MRLGLVVNLKNLLYSSETKLATNAVRVLTVLGTSGSCTYYQRYCEQTTLASQVLEMLVDVVDQLTNLSSASSQSPARTAASVLIRLVDKRNNLHKS